MIVTDVKRTKSKIFLTHTKKVEQRLDLNFSYVQKDINVLLIIKVALQSFSYQVVYEVENRMIQQIKVSSIIECIKAHLTSQSQEKNIIRKLDELI